MENTTDDIRHRENQSRFEALEVSQVRTEGKIDALTEATEGLVEFLKVSKVGIKWSGRVGRCVIFICKITTYVAAAYGIWKYGSGGVPK